MKLSALFEVSNGVPVTGLTVHRADAPGRVAFLRPASTQRRTVAGWVERGQLPAAKIFPAETLFVSTNGEGSHTFAYVSPVEFAANSDVAVLVPRQALSLPQKLYYARCITANRYRFSYGRKPKGERLASIELPELAALPSWLDQSDPTMFDGRDAPAAPQALTLDPSKWQPFVLDDLFTLKKGRRLTKAAMKPGALPFVGAIDKNNGVRQLIANDAHLHDAGTITVNYNGSVGEAFYQPAKFWASDDVNVLYPKFDMTPAAALFVCAVLRLEKYRYSYGRKWHLERMQETVIKLPATPQGQPDWPLMEAYILSLPYSSQVGAAPDV